MNAISVNQILALNDPKKILVGIRDMKESAPLNFCVSCRGQLAMHTADEWFYCVQDGLKRKNLRDR